MNTQQTDLVKEQETLPQTPAPLHVQQVSEAEQLAPAHIFPQPPRPPGPRSQYWMVLALATLLLVIALSVGMLLLIPLSQHPTTQVTPTPTTPTQDVTSTPGTIDSTPTPPPGVTPGPQTGPPGVSGPAYWDKILGTQPGTSKVERVSFATIMNTPTLQALVTVRYAGTEARLDVYVFDAITSAHPKQIFKLAGLVKGEASISGYSTVMTAEVDKNSSINTGKSLSAMTPDLFREFAWSSEEGTLVQVAFPGLFPDLTRYQAEADQARINQGQDTWKNSPVKVATAFEAQFLAWQRGVKATLLSGGGPHDVSAVVRVQETGVQGVHINMTLSRLEGNTHNLWLSRISWAKLIRNEPRLAAGADQIQLVRRIGV